MRKKTKSVFTHIIEYYTNNLLTKSYELTEVNRECLQDYWKYQIRLLAKSDNGCLEVDNFKVVTKCVTGPYDYQINKIIEKTIIN